MNGDPQLDQKLERLGAAMKPGEDFVRRVMEKGQLPEASRRIRWPWERAGSEFREGKANAERRTSNAELRMAMGGFENPFGVRRWTLGVRRFRIWTGATAVAAGLMLAAGLVARFHFRSRAEPVKTGVVALPVKLEQSTSTWEATFRRPVTMSGDSPAWEYSKQEFERVQWTDPTSHATLERNVPRGSVSLIVLDKY
jgi:hypothetical protein